ncbi:MAG TPA: radical SAM protein, partial [Pyrinomonadaceae bacterium]|nr:radical SAM protein [Pyrinomonadaceae bacterium]
MAWKASHYTHLIPLTSGDGVVYNGRSGALVKLSPGAFARCEAILSSTPKGKPLSTSLEGDDLFAHLIAGSFVVDLDFDELAFIEDQYNRERSRSQFLLTILPTFGCNLGCDYCFVGKKKGAMDRERQDQIVEFVTRRFATQKFPSMAVDWFGGEPLLALPAIEYLSAAFLDLCAKYDTPYSAQVITNGTMISDKAVEVMTNAGIDRLQITLDGLKEIHDVRRPSKLRVISSFEQTIFGLDRVVGKFVIRLRINVDKHNLPEAWRLLDFFAEQ